MPVHNKSLSFVYTKPCMDGAGQAALLSGLETSCLLLVAAKPPGTTLPADHECGCGEWEEGEWRISWEILGARPGSGENPSQAPLARSSHMAPTGCKMAGNCTLRKKRKQTPKIICHVG